jgi:ATP-dependent DNA helicase RecG
MPKAAAKSKATAESPASAAASGKSAAQKALEKLGLKRDIDFALHLPLRYEDETHITRLADARGGDTVQLEGVITRCEVQFRGRRQLLAVLDDGSETVSLRFLNFYPSHQKSLAVGTRVRVRGELQGGMFGWSMVHPSFKTALGDLPDALTPVYSTTAQLPQAYLRKAVTAALARAQSRGVLSETLPEQNRSNKLGPTWSLAQALHFLHHPTPDVSLAALEDRSHPAWQRLKAEELLAQQISQLQAKRERDARRSPCLPLAPEAGIREALTAVLPFQLTAAQQRVVQEISKDLARHTPMHRLLQGDVGSGKTVVAALSAAQCMDSGHQCALMAPTEILAEQHFRKLTEWLEPILAERGLQVAWLTGSQKKKARTEALALIESGQAALVVGTHAVIQEHVKFKQLALAIIDEQHRFGVAQRLALREKMNDSGEEPHLLMMTATPIPRTLAMSYYADLDVSTIDELPPGRTPIITKVISDQRRDEVVERIRGQVAQGRQIYWVCPLIEESEKIDLINATQTHADLCEALPSVMIGLLHSRMPVAEKKAVMSLFTSGQMGVLVSTTVIEVGVDVPNATLMVIEHAERFGLSQLHQLRGRVGRGAQSSACVLLYATGESGRLSETARARLKAMAETTDGFEIARRDLEIRGPGEFMGERQSGAQMLRFADLTTDQNWLLWARELAPLMLDKYPALAEAHVLRWLGSKADYLMA